MSDAAPDPEQPAAEAQPDPAVLRAEERLAMLRELAEIGMRLARALGRRVLAEDEADVTDEMGSVAKGRDPADAFSGLSRAIRLTLALEARTDEALRALKAGVEAERIEAAGQARADAAKHRAERVKRVQHLVLLAAVREVRDDDDFECFRDEYEERLDERESFWDDPQQPLRDSVERVCRFFGLTPDWSRWDGEAWIPKDPPIWPWVPAAEARPAGRASPPAHNGAAALAGVHALE